VWDIRRGLQVTRSLPRLAKLPLTVASSRAMAANALYASLFEPDIAQLDLRDLPASHMAGPDYLNVLRVLDIPQTVALAAERAAIRLSGSESKLAAAFAQSTGSRLNWPAGRITVEADRSRP
jgi:hypothetical protein